MGPYRSLRAKSYQGASFEPRLNLVYDHLTGPANFRKSVGTGAGIRTALPQPTFPMTDGPISVPAGILTPGARGREVASRSRFSFCCLWVMPSEAGTPLVLCWKMFSLPTAVEKNNIVGECLLGMDPPSFCGESTPPESKGTILTSSSP